MVTIARKKETIITTALGPEKAFTALIKCRKKKVMNPFIWLLLMLLPFQVAWQFYSGFA